MRTLKPLPPPGPPQSGGGIVIPLAVNILTIFLLSSLSDAITAHSEEDNGASPSVFFLFFQVSINSILWLSAKDNNSGGWATGFLLSALLVLLIGIGTCGQAYR